MLVLAAATLISCGGPAFALEYDPHRIFVLYRSGVLAPPSGQTGGSPDEFTYNAQTVQLDLSALGIERLDRALPWFEPESTATYTVDGDPIVLPHDLTDLYVMELADTNVTATVSAMAADSTNVVFSEPIYIGITDFAPNDSLFYQQWWLKNTGQYAGGMPGEDIRADPGWDIFTGELPPGGLATKVGVLDTGVNPVHEDLQPMPPGQGFIPNQGTGDNAGHGTAVAGIIGARGNNRVGVAGVNWGASIVSMKCCSDGSTCPVDAVIKAIDAARIQGIPIVNMSFHVGGLSYALLYAVQNAHAAGMFLVATMGNDDHRDRVFPAGHHETVEAVGAVFMDGYRWRNNAIPNCSSEDGGSNFGDWIDVVAPGGKMMGTTAANGGYSNIVGSCTEGFNGTSASAPVVSGVASLLKAYVRQLGGDDLGEIIHRTARDAGTPGFDEYYGWGTVDVDAALRFIGGSRVVERGVAADLVSVGSQIYTSMDLTGTTCYLPNACDPITQTVNPVKFAQRFELRKWVAFSTPFIEPPIVWARNGQSRGWGGSSIHREPDRAVGWGGILPGSVTAQGCSVYTYVYWVTPCDPPVFQYPHFWCPVTAANAKVAWTAVGRVRNDPDPSQSFFVPQAGNTMTPLEGASTPKSFTFFRGCPNNDGNSLPNNARVKVVARDASGNPIAGIPAYAVYLRLNGGTAPLPPEGQGFRGPGSDSIVSNLQYSSGASCPDVRFINADGPTNAEGVTYITFIGDGGIRDPQRKWGHYDSEIPVYIYWTKLQGRLTTGSSNGSYTLQIKSADVTGGLAGVLNQGQVVNSSDFNSITSHLNEPPSADPLNWWRDFNSDGNINTIDYNFVVDHLGHTCSVPNAQ